MRLWEELIPEMHIVIQFRSNYYNYYYYPIYVSLGFWNVDGMVVISELWNKRHFWSLAFSNLITDTHTHTQTLKPT